MARLSLDFMVILTKVYSFTRLQYMGYCTWLKVLELEDDHLMRLWGETWFTFRDIVEGALCCFWQGLDLSRRSSSEEAY